MSPELKAEVDAARVGDETDEDVLRGFHRGVRGTMDERASRFHVLAQALKEIRGTADEARGPGKFGHETWGT